MWQGVSCILHCRTPLTYLSTERWSQITEIGVMIGFSALFKIFKLWGTLISRCSFFHIFQLPKLVTGSRCSPHTCHKKTLFLPHVSALSTLYLPIVITQILDYFLVHCCKTLELPYFIMNIWKPLKLHHLYVSSSPLFGRWLYKFLGNSSFNEATSKKGELIATS